jgi:hypothetical protein
MTLWHVCGTPGRPPVTAKRNRLTPEAVAWAFVGAPSAIRTRDLLLRRQSLYPLSYRGWRPPRQPQAEPEPA